MTGPAPDHGHMNSHGDLLNARESTVSRLLAARCCFLPVTTISSLGPMPEIASFLYDPALVTEGLLYFGLFSSSHGLVC